jgi:hypothetical protein
MSGDCGRLIGRCFRIKNLMQSGVTYTAGDLTVEEANVLELIETEKPIPGAKPDGNRS